MSNQLGRPPRTARPRSAEAGRYRWVALTDTTMAVFMSTLDGSIRLDVGVMPGGSCFRTGGTRCRDVGWQAAHPPRMRPVPRGRSL